MFDLRLPSPPQWLETVLADINSFLIDHAACERKASATALSFVVRYPDQKELVTAMTQVAQDELEHFAQVTSLIHQRGLQLGHDAKDPYVNALLRLVRGPSLERLIDRLLIFGVVEGRGCERFKLIADNIQDKQLAHFYHELFKAEARHHAAFLHLVRLFTTEDVWRPRLQELLDEESKIMAGLEFRAALH